MMRLFQTRWAVPVALALVIAACSPLTPRDQGRSFMFTLETVTPASQAQYDGTLVIDHPTARIELDTYRVALIRADGVFDYFAHTRWVDFISPMVLDTMVFSLEDSGLFDSVVSEQSAFAGDYVLKSEIRSFNAVYDAPDAPPEIRVALNQVLLAGDRKTRMATFTAKGSAKATDNTLTAIHNAFNAAFSKSQKATVTHIAKAMENFKNEKSANNEMP